MSAPRLLLPQQGTLLRTAATELKDVPCAPPPTGSNASSLVSSAQRFPIIGNMTVAAATPISSSAGVSAELGAVQPRC
jgi:hypothetical protein